MSKRSIVFYEINQDAPSRLPVLNEIEEQIFDYLNDEGAASKKSITRQHQQTKSFAIDNALGTLIDKHLITRRNVTTEHDE